MAIEIIRPIGPEGSNDDHTWRPEHDNDDLPETPDPQPKIADKVEDDDDRMN